MYCVHTVTKPHRIQTGQHHSNLCGNDSEGIYLKTGKRDQHPVIFLLMRRRFHWHFPDHSAQAPAGSGIPGRCPGFFKIMHSHITRTRCKDPLQSICVLTHTQMYVLHIQFSDKVSFPHQMRRSQVLPRYPHSSVSAYDIVFHLYKHRQVPATLHDNLTTHTPFGLTLGADDSSWSQSSFQLLKVWLPKPILGRTCENIPLLYQYCRYTIMPAILHSGDNVAHTSPSPSLLPPSLASLPPSHFFNPFPSFLPSLACTQFLRGLKSQYDASASLSSPMDQKSL